MSKNDTVLFAASDVLQALALLTRLPVAAEHGTRGAAAAWAYPVVGLIVGALASVAGLLGYATGLPNALVALLALATLIVLTGAMHEDGLADAADGLWGGWSREKRLEIMKDSRIGTYGVLALILSVAARWGALWLLFDIGPGTAISALIASCMVSRATMPSLMHTLPRARSDGLSHSVGAVSASVAGVAWGIAAVAALLLTGSDAIFAVFWAGVCYFAVATIARRKIGGQTGDILGACQQITEIAVLFSILA